MGIRSQVEFEQMGESAKTVSDPVENNVIEGAPAIRVSTQVGQVRNPIVPAFQDKFNVLDSTTVEGLSLATPRVKGEQGSLFMGHEDMGDKLHIEIISYNYRWTIGTGEKESNPENKKYFRVSYDDETVTKDGMQIDEYMDELRGLGFKNPNKSPYIDIWGLVTWSAKTGPIAVNSRPMVCLQCSKTSISAFTAFAMTRGIFISRGLAEPIDIIGVEAKKQQNARNERYTNFAFFAPTA